jgi:Zn finger protein HypA/HybF involved in hydrogenase expression
MSKYAECECRDCGLEFKITFTNGYPKVIHCPQCTSVLIKLNRIDRTSSGLDI